MQTDEDFNIHFVSVVKRHRCLYDKKIPEYRNKDEQEKSWMEIAQETRESVSHCKERWRNLRACLSRYIKQQNSSDPQHKPYYLSEHMQFLLPFLKSHQDHSMNGSFISKYEYHSMDMKTSDMEDTNEPDFHHTLEEALGNMSNRHLSETDTTRSVNCVPDVHLEIDTQEGEPEVLFTTSTDRIQSERKRKRLDNMHNKSNCSIGGYPDNADMDFFRSILPDIHGMTALQKRKFKIGILELIDDTLIKYPDKKQNAVASSASNP